MFDKTAELYDLIYSFKNYEQESEQICDYIKGLKPDAKDVLDVACGTGMHASYLSRFFQVDGIDLNERFIEIAAERNPDGKFLCRDMTQFQLDKHYDIVMCLFSAIAYVGTYDALIKSLKQFKNHLNQGGIVIVEPWFAPEAWEVGRLDMLTVEDEQNNKICRMSYSAREGQTSILNYQYLIGSSAGVVHHSERHELALFTVDEMLGAFTDAGMTCEYEPIGISGRGIYMGKML